MTLSRQKIGSLDCILVPPLNGQSPKAAVVLCHGFGAPGQDLVPVGMELAGREGGPDEAVYIFPAAPLELDPMYDGRAWWMIDVARLQYLMAIGETRQMRGVEPAELPDCRQKIFEVIEWAQRSFQLDSTQILVGGFSQGAMLTTDVALHYGQPLGGLIIWSGALICETDWRQAAAKRSAMPVVQSHGTEDMILSIEGARELESLLTSAGHAVQFHEFDGPHTIPFEAIDLTAELIGRIVERARSGKTR